MHHLVESSQQAHNAGVTIHPHITNEETCILSSDTSGETRHEGECIGWNQTWAERTACLIHSPTQVTRVLRFGILAAGVGIEGEAGSLQRRPFPS